MPLYAALRVHDALYSISRQTGQAYRIGEHNDFGIELNDPRAMMWDGSRLYMIERETTPSGLAESWSLYLVDQNTGAARAANVIPQVRGNSPRNRLHEIGTGVSIVSFTLVGDQVFLLASTQFTATLYRYRIGADGLWTRLGSQSVSARFTTPRGTPAGGHVYNIAAVGNTFYCNTSLGRASIPCLLYTSPSPRDS